MSGVGNYSISIRSFGVHAVLVEWPKEVCGAILNDILQFVNYLENNCLDGAKYEIVPSYNSITLVHRGKPIVFEEFKTKLNTWYEERNATPTKQKFLWRLPVCYDLEFGIDLEEVSEKLGMSVTKVIESHTHNVFTVYGIGFLPGFMYLGGLPTSLEVPRRSTPRLKVQKGAVGLAAKQTGIYPQESPGGWNIIGNCPIPMFDPKSNNPCFVSVGDQVQFYQIERAPYDLCKIEGEVGIYKPEKIKLDA